MNDSLFATALVSIVLVALSVNATPVSAQEPKEKIPEEVLAAFRDASKSVSYTHLTLPTTPYV